MSDYIVETRKRRQNLLIVEGKHEKNKLFSLILKCFPELEIAIDDIWIYGTNIYKLYEDIAAEYDDDWAERKVDVDLPFIISKKKNFETVRYKEDFTNIIIIFDYERHDPNFSEDKILKMQEYFADAADMGHLYINYPMLESYQHIKSLPDAGYAERKIPVSLPPGKKYKNLVREETVIGKLIELPNKIDDLLLKNYGVYDKQTREQCCERILNISNIDQADDDLQRALFGVIDDTDMQTIKGRLKDWISKSGHLHTGQSFWLYVRNIFMSIIYHNICKANRIQNNQFDIEENKLKECFYLLSFNRILRIQNEVSKEDSTGFIWVLNTCILLVAEYRFFWKQ